MVGQADPGEFRRYGSARRLYNFHIDHVDSITDGRDPAITAPRYSATFDEYSISEIRRAAATGIYDIRGFGAKRKLPHFDDLFFLGASISRYPLEGYREQLRDEVTSVPLREDADNPENSDHDRGDELWRAFRAGQGGARAGAPRSLARPPPLATGE